jgi:uncharacterized membrane protein YqaE (UPF0057 family)
MRYLFAILLPPIAVLSCGKPVQCLLNLVLCLLLWVPGMIHAILVVHEFHAERRSEELVRALRVAGA